MAVSKKNAHRVIAYTAKTESGGKFNSWNPDDTGAGISFGIIQFNQAGGRLKDKPGSPLAELLKEMQRASPAQFTLSFGPYATNLVSTAWVKAANFNERELKDRMIQAAALPVFQTAQLEQARKGYWQPAERAAAKYGIKSERGHAMLFDTAVQWGPARMEKFLAKAAVGGLAGVGAMESDVLAKFAVEADAGKYHRRANILADKHLSDASIVAMGAAGVGVLGVLALVAYKVFL
jgi:hypothetical protein